jgi:glycosyltransferase involved in cell wall biosynthesis
VNIDNPKVSVIIPVHNVAEYLQECLDSVIAQTIKNIEILCVDDASTDNSASILSYNAAIDNRIKVITHKKNMGSACSRNTGILHAKGEYIYYLDADDMIKPEMLEKTTFFADKNHLDVTFFYSKAIEDGRLTNKLDHLLRLKHHYPDIMTGQELYLELIKHESVGPAVWKQIYRTEFIMKNNLYFYNIRIAEDVPYHFLTYMLAERVKYIPEVYHYYRLNDNGLTKEYTERKMKERFSCFFSAESLIYRYVTKNVLPDNIESALIEYIRKRYDTLSVIYLEVKEDFTWTDSRFRREWRLFQISKTQLFYFIHPTDKLSTSIAEVNNIIIYGAKRKAQETLSYLIQQNKYILGFAVTDRENNSNQIMGHKVCEIQEFAKYKKSATVLVAVAKKYEEDVKSYIKKLGFEKYIIME